MQALQQGSTLQGGRYRIERVLGQGGFGITYLAVQSGLERKVAIKEFFMKELCNRDGSTSHVTLGVEGNRGTVERFREKFLKEARFIGRLNHPHIIHVHEIFEENGTAYYVMDYAEGGSLADLVKREGHLSEPEAIRYILQVAEALAYIHGENMNHLDVKPANILLNDCNEAVLIDFGLSKQYDALTGGQTSTTPVGISEGYAPMEQYKQGGVSEFSPETDIYALGATFFMLLTGKTPPGASDIFENGVPVDELKALGVRVKTIGVIKRAMRPKKKDRTSDVNVFIESLRNLSSTKANETKDEITGCVVDDSEATKIDMSSVEEPDEDGVMTSSEGIIEKHSSVPLKRFFLIGGLVSLAVVLILRTSFMNETQESESRSKEVVEKNESRSSVTQVQQEVSVAEEPREVKATGRQKVESSKPEVVNVNGDALAAALKAGDYVAIQKLANDGYAPAYVPLAKYYLKNNEYELAEKYARKASSAGVKGARTVIQALENLGYYD